MRHVLIQEYRGWEIFFDTEQDIFYTHSNEWDKDEYKKSFAATKKFIDDYIKANTEFKPVTVVNQHGQKVILLGIRKDKAFMCLRQGETKPSQFEKCGEKDYFLEDERNEPIFAEIAKIEKELEVKRQKVVELRKQLVKVNLVEYRKQITGEE